MEACRQEIILGCVAIYMLLCIAVGLWAMRRTHSAEDFFVAGKSLGPVVVSLAVFSSTLSGFGFVGGPGLVYATGMSSFWMVVAGSSMGYALGFFLVAKRIRMVAELKGAISMPDILFARYGSETVRFFSALTILLGVMGYMATQILAMGLVLQTILSGSESFADISLVTCVLISSALLVFYCVTGGIVASVYTDLVQGLIMIVAGVLVVFAAMSVFDGGMAEISTILLEKDPESIMPFGTLGPILSMAWFFLFGVGQAGQPHVATKMMMSRSIEDNKLILPITLVGYFMAAMLWLSIGIAMRALVLGDLQPPLAEADQAAPAFLGVYAHPLLAGVVFAGLFAAIMSTADGFVNIGAAAIIHDIPRALRGRSLDNELMWARVATVTICAIGALFALYAFYIDGALVALLGSFGWGTFAAALAPVLMLGLNWRRASPRAAASVIILSLLINLGFQLSGIKLPYALDPGFLALLVSFILFIAMSWLDRPQKLDRGVDRILDL